MTTTRFAPSPTGPLHLGNVRTALLNWLYARKHGGRFLLRFEDTDRERSQATFISRIQDDLRWLGLDWDGEALFQSAHQGKHERALAQLAERGSAYRCFCSESQLALDRKLAASRGRPPRYAGRCRGLSSPESENRALRQPFVWRLATHGDSGEVAVADMLRGDVCFARVDLDDPVLLRSDGSFTFLLPNAVDDAIDGVTHVLRGDDHLTNSAYQVWLLGMLELPAPRYLHHGLLLGEDGAKLSKRSGSRSLAELREAGLFAESLMQAMARLGHPNMPDRILGASDLALHFDAGNLSTSHVRWSDDAMWRWQARVLHDMDHGRLVELLRPLFGYLDETRLREFASLVQANLERPQDALAFARLVDCAAAVPSEVEAVWREAGKSFFALALKTWEDMAQPDWQTWAAALKGTSGRRGRALFLPLRAALTGAAHGPEMHRVLEFLGAGGVSSRLKDVIERLV